MGQLQGEREWYEKHLEPWAGSLSFFKATLMLAFIMSDQHAVGMLIDDPSACRWHAHGEADG